MNLIETKKILTIRECVVGKKCDICGKEIPPTVKSFGYGKPLYDYYEVTTSHGDWGNDSVESYEHFDACSPNCADKLWKEYIRDSSGTANTKCISIEHINGWKREDTQEGEKDAEKRTND